MSVCKVFIWASKLHKTSHIRISNGVLAAEEWKPRFDARLSLLCVWLTFWDWYSRNPKKCLALFVSIYFVNTIFIYTEEPCDNKSWYIAVKRREFLVLIVKHQQKPWGWCSGIELTPPTPDPKQAVRKMVLPKGSVPGGLHRGSPLPGPNW